MVTIRNRPDGSIGCAKADLVGGHLERGGQRPRPEAEPLADGCLRGPQDGNGFVPLTCLLEYPGHHLPQDAAPTVAGQDVNRGDAGCSYLTARHGQAERIGAAAADNFVTVQRADESVELDRVAVILDGGRADLLVE